MIRTVLITGCGAGGIGSALASELHHRGFGVFATGRNLGEIDPVLPSGIERLALDVTDAKSIAEAVASVERQTSGGLDMLINNAGIMQIMPFADTPATELQRLFDVNVIAVWAVTQAFLPLLLKAQGTVVGLGSINGDLCPSFFAAYNASKAALEALMRTIRRELAPLGIKVILAKSGSIKTALFQNAAPTVLLEGSLYAPVAEWLRTRGMLQNNQYMDLKRYAQALVTELIHPRPRAVVWKGGLVWISWLLSFLSWETMLDSTLISGNGLNVLHNSSESRIKS